MPGEPDPTDPTDTADTADTAHVTTPEDLQDEYLAGIVTVDVDQVSLDAGEAARRLGTPLFVITAWNPGRERPGDAANTAANAALDEALGALGARRWAARGCDPVGPYFEDSIAVRGPDLDTVRELGRRFRQEAVYELTPTELVVHGCRSSWTRRRPLP